MKKLLMISALSLFFVACGGAVKEQDLVQKYQLTPASAVHWDQTIMRVIPGEAKFADWYGNENPIKYLQRKGEMRQKDFQFLQALSEREPNQVAQEDYETFLEMLTGYVNALPRDFYLANSNLKDPKGLVRLMVQESNSRLDNPSRYIKEEIADEYEWNKIVEFSKQDDLDRGDVKKLRKILNSFMKDRNFYNPEIWFRREVSSRTMALAKMSEERDLTKQEINNINAEAMFIAYPGFFSNLTRWDD